MKENITILFTFFIGIIFPNLALADHITVQGNVSGEWNTDTVLVTGNLTIPDGADLLIQPGTVVSFLGSFRIQVEGSLNATGAQTDSIYFQAADTAGFMTDTIPNGGWQGIRFDHNRITNEPSVFNYCRFSFGKNTDPDTLKGNGGALSVKSYSNILIDRCRFVDNFAIYNGGAIALDSADITIRNSLFSRNRSGLTVAPWGYGGAISSDYSNPDIRWNTFTGNSSTGVGGGISLRYEDGDIYNNSFLDNLSAIGGGLCVLHIPECTHRINTNLFAGNEALYFGGGVASLVASPYYINNTIADNIAMYGGGFYCKDSVSPDFYNCIIWGNEAAVGPQGYFFEVYSQADFFYCDVEGGPSLFGGSGGGEAFFGAWDECIDIYPKFYGFGEYPYFIGEGSPCIDGGSVDTSGFLLPATDLAGNQRISHGIIDIGAYEILYAGVEEEGKWRRGEEGNDLEINLWPNPTEGKFKVQSSEFKVQNVKCKVELESLELVDIYGRVMSYNNNKTIEQLNHGTLEFDISHLPDGIYLAIISVGNISITKKLVKVSR